MSRNAVESLELEVATLQVLLDELPESRFVERMGLESRLQEARSDLEKRQNVPQPKHLPITFRGAPVDGTSSINASFAALALKGFVDATDTFASSVSSDGLKTRGPLPGPTNERGLRIVDTALGSFGFELELPPPLPDESSLVELHLEPAEGDPYATAIDTTLSLPFAPTNDSFLRM